MADHVHGPDACAWRMARVSSSTAQGLLASYGALEGLDAEAACRRVESGGFERSELVHRAWHDLGPDVTTPPDVLLQPSLPDALKAHAAAPFALFVRGARELLSPDVVRVGVVGSRRPRESSCDVAWTVARDLARQGIAVVSGLAMGVDTAAHMGALDGGGPTIAVLGTPVDRVHPVRNRELAERITGSGGLLVSELASGDETSKHTFRLRNRLIAAMSDFLVVVQARPSSGSMITVDEALRLGIGVGAVPSWVDDVAFAGSLELLRSGAPAILDGNSVLRAMGRELAGEPEQHELDSFLDRPRGAVEIAAHLEQPLDQVLTRLLELELDGLVRMTGDGRYVNVRPSSAGSYDGQHATTPRYDGTSTCRSHGGGT